MRIYRKAGAAWLFLAAALFVACQGTIVWEGWGIEFEVTVENGRVTVPETPRGEPAMLCFYDKDGKVIGGGVVEPGTTLPIPPGTVDAKLKSIEDQDNSAGPGRKTRRIATFDIVKFAVDPRLAEGVTEYAMRVWAPSLDEAEATAQAVEEALLTGRTAPGGVYEVDYLVHSILKGSSVAFLFADNRSFSQLEVTLDGAQVSTLDEMMVRSSAGLHVAGFEFPVSELDVEALHGIALRTDFAFRVENESDPATRAGKHGSVTFTL